MVVVPILIFVAAFMGSHVAGRNMVQAVKILTPLSSAALRHLSIPASRPRPLRTTSTNTVDFLDVPG